MTSTLYVFKRAIDFGRVKRKLGNSGDESSGERNRLAKHVARASNERLSNGKEDRLLRILLECLGKAPARKRPTLYQYAEIK